MGNRSFDRFFKKLVQNQPDFGTRSNYLFFKERKMLKGNIVILCVFIYCTAVFSCLTNGTIVSKNVEMDGYKEISLNDFKEFLKGKMYSKQQFIIELPLEKVDYLFYTREAIHGIVDNGTLMLDFKLNEQEYANIYQRIEKGKIYKLYITPRNLSYETTKYYNVDRIEGLMTLEELALLLEREKAEREAIELSKKLADEEANRYNPDDFVIVPSRFRPADYKNVDLFDSVAEYEKLSYYSSRRLAVSDVIFIRQTGTDITFSTDDRAISQTMKVSSRSGLSSGQRVTVFYTYKWLEWQVIAIKRR
jgi:hypothetical protein